MRVVVWGENHQSVFSPHGGCFCQISRVEALFFQSSSLGVLGRNTRTWSGVTFRRRHEPPGAEGTAPIPRGESRDRPRLQMRGGPPSPAPLGPAEPFLPAVCLCTWLDRFRCDWGKGAVCLAVKFLGTREDEGRKCQSPLAWQSLGKKGPREGSALLRVPVWRLGVSFKQGLVEHVWILPSEQTG